jgi:hypothetical protein
MKVIFISLIVIIIIILIMVIFNLGPFKNIIKSNYTPQQLRRARKRKVYAQENEVTNQFLTPKKQEDENVVDDSDMKYLEEKIRETKIIFRKCFKQEFKEQLGDIEYKKKCGNVEPNEFGKPINEVNFFEYSEDYKPSWGKPFEIDPLPENCPNPSLNNSLYKIWRQKQEALRDIFRGKKSCLEVSQNDVDEYFLLVGQINNENEGELDNFEKDNKKELKNIEFDHSNNPDLNKISNTCLAPPGPKCYKKFIRNDENIEVLDFSLPGCKAPLPTNFAPIKTRPPKIIITPSP